MGNAIRDILSDHASSEDEEGEEDEDDDEEHTGHGTLSMDEEPGWVMETMSERILHRMENSRQEQMRLDELTQPGWGDLDNYFRGGDMAYRTFELTVPAVGKPPRDSTAPTPSPTTIGEHMQALHIVPRRSKMPPVMSPQGSSEMRLGLEQPQADNHIVPLMPAVVPDLPQIEIAKPVPPVSYYQCVKHP
jgi:hypothetical protein